MQVLQSEMIPWNTPKGNYTPRISDHFVQRLKERFPDLVVSNTCNFVLRVMCKSSIIVRSEIGDSYYFWHSKLDCIMVMEGYMGTFKTVYKASDSPWFKELGHSVHDGLSVTGVFGQPEGGMYWHLKSENEQKKWLEKEEKRQKKLDKDYEYWFLKQKVNELSSIGVRMSSRKYPLFNKNANNYMCL